MVEMKEEEKLKLKKLIKELEKIKGRHTELVSVYIPSGYNLVDAMNQIFQEKGTASNIKSKTTRKNVLTALEKILQHLKLFRKTPPNGLVIFCGNVSPEEGKEDIRLWSYEPPVPISQKIYWCDQTFVLDPLKDLISEKEVYGLIVLDAKEATIGLLKGKRIEKLKTLESTVPSKTVKGGMCVEEDTLIQLEDGNIIPIKALCPGDKILSYSFKEFKSVFANSFEIFKRKPNIVYELILKEPSTSLIVTPEHLVFVITEKGIEEISVEEINIGDRLLYISEIKTKNNENINITPEMSQLLGYLLGDGTIDTNRIIFYDKDIQLLNIYKKIAERLIEKEAVILRKGNTYELRLYKKSFVDFVVKNFPKLTSPRKLKDIDESILKLPNEKLKYFIKGLFDAEAYVDGNSIGLRMSNEKIVKKLQLILIRFNIISSVRGPDKFNRYELRITNPVYIKNFIEKIGFSSLKKMKKLSKIARDYQKGKSIRAPVSGVYVRKLLEECGLKKEDVKKYGMFLVGKRNIGYPCFKKLIEEIEAKCKCDKILNLLKKFYNSGLIISTIKEKRKIKVNKIFYDLYVPGINSFVANGIVVHNSQKRYDRLRDDALNEFLVKVGEEASNLLLKQENLKGVIIGGPGPVKETFYDKNYLHYQIQKKVLGVKDIGSTDEYGLEELVFKSQDLLKEATISKERELMQKFFSELKNNGNVVYGFEETKKALEAGAVDVLLISEEFNWLHVKFRCNCGFATEKDLPKHLVEKQKCPNCGQKLIEEESRELVDELVEKASSFGARVEYISTETSEGIQFRELGGIGAFLRYRI
jgi:peptide subunit release factor 1 (eRF1)/intein/homing endonuclease